ncbi:MAG: selenocysteine-specific translation elongation factor [Chloroflexota bacterium]|nr:selenocysteine-specific translation elongation factor [Chloroflexota bacterium]
MRIVGTAGHVDHGKSTLVRALTGIDPDRLKEEKARGMTIDLGFAWFDLPLPGGAVEPIGVVDVPGHIDFIKNMLAGVGGIDAALLVIAADEGVMPQTREHLAILDLLAVPSALVVMTKIDLVGDPEWLDLVELDIGELLQETRFAAAPVVRVSPMTGAGVDTLRGALAGQLTELTPRRDRARPRLPIDRIFSLSGFGTIVTGTLSDGSFAVGDAVEILPGKRSARIRGLQTHKQQVDAGKPGSRLAMNLTGVGVDDLRRGDVVVKPNSIEAAHLIDVSVRLLPGVAKPLRHNARVDFFSGAAEKPAVVRLLGAEELKGGESGWLQLRLAEPVVAVAGDRFILRQPSPSETLGGGVVLNPHPRRRWRRFDERVIERLQTLAHGAPDEVILDALGNRPFQTAAELAENSGLGVDAASETLAELLNAGAIARAVMSPEPRYMTLGQRNQVMESFVRALGSYHAEHPLRRAMPRGELRSRLQESLGRAVDVRLFNALAETAAAGGIVSADENGMWLPGHAVRLTSDQQQRMERTLQTLADAGYAPPNAQDVLQMLGGDERLMEMLVEQDRLVPLGGGVIYRREEFEAMLAGIRGYIAEHGSMTLAEARDHFGVSRRYVQALLEEADARRITRREGDTRVLR